ncbi:MAG: flagellar hook-length control protein FliK [Candidatus Riflebacteria bacterium]|nr:flagellar hook-length control protein FliK [Candidatus Riflebacteria bacterium]
MRINLDLPSTLFKSNQSVKGEVISSNEKGSLLLINGQLARTDKKLSIGQKLTGSVDSKSQNEEQIEVDLEFDKTDISSEDLQNPTKFLTEAELPRNFDGKSTIEILRSFGLPLNLKTLETLQKLFKAFGIPKTFSDMEAASLLIGRNLPLNAFPTLKKYFSGTLNFENLLSKLDPKVMKFLQKNWTEGKTFENISKLLKGEKNEIFDSVEKEQIKDAAENLFLQEILSKPPEENTEGRLFFQWPIYWSHQEIPDTLEGEAFYPPKSREDMGFALRVMVNPPRLGKIELLLNQLKEGLWVLFMPEKSETESKLIQSFSKLKKALENKSWKSIKLSIGEYPNRRSFLSPENSASSHRSPRKLDVKA